MSDLSHLKFFVTQPHACSYLPERAATTLFLDPQVVPDRRLHSLMSRQGFRRSGNYLYRPHCGDCHACLPSRIAVGSFRQSRRFRRVEKLNHDIKVSVEAAANRDDFYQLYARYINARHQDGDMYPASREQFSQFLLNAWADTRFVCFWQDQRLLAVAVTDQLDDGLSAVYSFFEPDAAHLSLGTLAILWQIAACRRMRLPYLYLGYLVRHCRKMAYKEDFSPLEVLTDAGWQRLENSSPS